MAKFTFLTVGNMVFLEGESGQCWKSWMADDFTERKAKNAMKMIRECCGEDTEFVRVTVNK